MAAAEHTNCATSAPARVPLLRTPIRIASSALSRFPFSVCTSGKLMKDSDSAALNQFPIRTPSRFRPLTLPIAAATSDDSTPLSAASMANRRTAVRYRGDDDEAGSSSKQSDSNVGVVWYWLPKRYHMES